MSLLEVDHVTHRYKAGPGRPVLDDVSLAVEQDQVVSIVGESGCGKTTLGKLVAGLLMPSAGQIRFDGRNIAELRGKEQREWRRQVQMVHQDPYGSLNPGLTIGATLGPPVLHHKLVTKRALESRLLDALRQVGLDATPDFLRRYPHQLSGGQRQRVAVARAISMQPRLVIADEVTSMLDVSMRVSILDLLLSFRQQRSLTYVFISHDFGVVRYFSQGGRIIVMFYGVVVEEGPVEELIAAPQHPYTHLLLQSIPVPDPGLASAREQAAPAQSRLVAEPASGGCVFANRCPLVQDVCRRQVPPLADVASGHRSACFFPDQVPPIRTRLQEGDPDDQAGRPRPPTNRTRDADHVDSGAIRRSVGGEPRRG